MSRVGNNPITIPEDVTVDVTDSVITVKGKLGEIKQSFSDVWEYVSGFSAKFCVECAMFRPKICIF